MSSVRQELDQDCGSSVCDNKPHACITIKSTDIAVDAETAIGIVQVFDPI